MLTAAGYPVEPHELQPVQGRERSDWRCDVYRWEAYPYIDGVPQWLVSWDTMTAIVKAGDLTVEADGAALFVSANPKAADPTPD